MHGRWGRERLRLLQEHDGGGERNQHTTLSGIPSLPTRDGESCALGPRRGLHLRVQRRAERPAAGTNALTDAPEPCRGEARPTPQRGRGLRVSATAGSPSQAAEPWAVPLTQQVCAAVRVADTNGRTVAAGAGGQKSRC